RVLFRSARAERFPDRLLRGEAARVVLRRVRLRIAVRALRLGEAPLLEALAVPLERRANALDLDQVDPDAQELEVRLEPVRELRDRRDDRVRLHRRALDLVGAELAGAYEDRPHPVTLR